MNNKNLEKYAAHLDKIGAYSIADEIDQKLFKIAQRKDYSAAFERDPNLPEFDENILGKTGNLFSYISAGISNVFSSKSNLFLWFISELNAFIVSDFAKSNPDWRNTLWRAKAAAQKIIGTKAANDVSVRGSLAKQLQGSSVTDMWNAFGNWVNIARQNLRSNSKYSPFLIALTTAEEKLASMVDSEYKPTNRSVESPGSKPIETPSTTQQPLQYVTEPSSTSKLEPSINLNKALYEIVYKSLKPSFPSFSASEFAKNISSIYSKVTTDDVMKQLVIEKINKSSYSNTNKIKLIQLFNKKIGVPENSNIPSDLLDVLNNIENVSSGTEEKKSPFVSEQDTKDFYFLNEKIEELKNMNDNDFYRVHAAKSSNISELLMKSFKARSITLEEYEYLKNELSILNLRYRKIQENLK